MNHRNNLSSLEQEKTLLSPEEKDFYLKNIFLRGKINSAFLYPGSSEIYTEVVNDKSYSPNTIELHLLKKHHHSLQKLLGNYVIDYGCGNGEKAEALLANLRDKHVQYIAVDYSYSMIDAAKKKINQLKNIKVGEHILLDGGDFTLGKKLDKVSYLRLGETFANYEDEEIVHILNTLGNQSRSVGNTILFSFPLIPEDEIKRNERKNFYNNSTGIAFRRHGLQNLGLNPDDFYDMVDRDYKGTIKTGIVPKTDMIISLSNGERLPIKAQTFYPFHQNRVFSRQEVETLLKKAGAHAVFFAEEEGVGLVVAKKVPERFQKHKAKVQKALLGVLLIGAGMGLKTGMDLKKHHQEFDRVQKELVKGKTLENYGFGTSEQTITFQEGEAILRQTTQQLAGELYQELLHWFDLQNVHDSEKIQLLIQSQLLRKKEDGQYYNLSQLQSQHSSEKTEFLSSFVREFRVILGSYGMNERIAQGISAFEPTLTLPGEIRGIFSDLSTPATAPKFRANLENTTPFAQNPFLSSDPKSIALQENFDAGVFDYIQTIGNYKTSDGKVYKLILIDKKMTLPSGEILKGPFLLAAESSDSKRTSQAAQKYALSLGQKVIKDYLQHWSSPRE